MQAKVYHHGPRTLAPRAVWLLCPCGGVQCTSQPPAPAEDMLGNATTHPALASSVSQPGWGHLDCHSPLTTHAAWLLNFCGGVTHLFQLLAQ